MSQPVTVTRDGNVAIVTIDNPPVNAMSFHVREPLHARLLELRDDSSVEALVLACAGRTFVAGADITEFGKPIQYPFLPEIIDLIETFQKPTVAAVHGTALGGGLELAMGCHFRVAEASAKMGLPEVKLGILPGAGGTQRLPRLVGPSKALKMIVSGTPIGAKDALASGLVDEVVDGDLLANAIRFAREKAASKATLIAVSQRDDKLAPVRANMAAFDAEIAEVLKKSKGLDAPKTCAQSVRNALTMPFAEAATAERNFFHELVKGDQSRAQRHLFFAEREANKVPGVGKDDKPRKIAKVGVIGAGTMGGGISMSFVNGGIPVTILEMSDEALKRGLGVIEKNYGISVSRGSLTEEAKAKRMSMFKGTTDYADLADCDLIIEAVFEEMGVKEKVFGTLDKIAKPGAILASNTSYLDVNEIAKFTSRPQDVLGMHFFSPANVMKLLEIVRGSKTAPDVIATAIAVGKAIGKVPVVVGVCHGFVGNRMLGARGAEAEDLLLEGATPAQADKVFTDFGWPMGTYQMWDLAGLDIGWRTRKSLGKTAAIGDALCEQGRYGQKTGKGYYLYPDGRTPVSDPEVEALIVEKAREKGINRRDISNEEITERMMYPMINEGARILEEGIAIRSSDIDTVWVNGYGFPVGKGGPMFWAELVGLPKIVERLDYWYGKTGKEVYNPSPLLRKLAAQNGSFADATKAAA
ncbi:3-hydroxyacyl-CoA dehydrogenase NAD-binding domain-containing protein [Mesorhizobium australicum]|uniref:Short chain enoyl-CoA hydratase /3-hydroxyacyl-CoA dehydrogenase n=1 Tax=Mesorhizobium australicum TaxID=536018 RepID=A0A1X7NQT9_9HYPH|nr:3-hydroxyacyl-CoA dehydrogenase NAD-binding domain-containing protein [Mesorhizobium australicum]SMH40366.1 short chain enoyl-CoA hydratase /3-hydroxyacyl-CoA dehydrogenase [Mesorhizobium australicum]